MSDEPARPEGVAAGEEEAPAPTEEPVAPTEPAAVQDPEITTVPNETTEVAPAPDEKKAETEEAEKAVTHQPPPQQALEQESIKQKESSVKIATKPTESKTEFPLADANVLAELKVAEEKAREAAKAVQSLKEQLAANTKKDVMTEEDIRSMEQKQKELMDKMQEFEEITKKIQNLVGLIDVPSSQLGAPKTILMPSVGIAETKGPSLSKLKERPLDTLPKVIICGTSDVNEVPRIIVCEPTSARDGRHPLFHQIQNQDGAGKEESKNKEGSKSQDQPMSPGPTNDQYLYPGCPGYMGYPNMQGNVGPVKPVGDGSNMVMGQGGPLQSGMSQSPVFQPGWGQCGMVQPGMGQGGFMQPSMGQGGMMQPSLGQGGMMQPNMWQGGMLQPGMGQCGMSCPGVGQSAMAPYGQPGQIQPPMGQPGVIAPSGLQPTMVLPGMMQYLTMQLGSPQLGPSQQGLSQPTCAPCGHHKKRKIKNFDGESTASGVIETEQNASRSKTDGSDVKRSCRKRKQCICQTPGLYAGNTNQYPFPTM